MIQDSVVVSQLPESIKGDNPQAVVEQCVFDVMVRVYSFIVKLVKVVIEKVNVMQNIQIL